MGQIQSSVGLVTGIPITDTVDKLMQLNSIPRTRLASRTQTLTDEQTAIATLTTLVIGVQLTSDRLGQSSLFNATKVTSSRTDFLTARSTGSPAVGSYSFVPVRQAQSQQLTSSLFASADQTLSSGAITVYTGGFLDSSLQLDELNGGAGVFRGYVRITDRSGSSKNVDLRFAQTASDVVNAINATDNLGVVAKLEGDRFVLTDISGGSSSNLKVEEVGSGTTAQDLGLGSIDQASTVANGTDLTKLNKATALHNLRDGLGLELPKLGYALRFNLADGTTVNFNTHLDGAKASLGQLIDEINATGDGKLQASISTDGHSLSIKDLTSGSSSFSISSPDGDLVDQLGLNGSATGGVITGSRLVAGLSDTLLSSLNGGQGLGELGSVTITDGQGGSDSIDLSGSTTLNEVIDRLNSGASNASFRVELNRTKTGISIVDTSGGTGSLQVQNGDAANAATALQIEGSSATGTLDSGSLHLQYVNKNTKITDFLGGGQSLSQSSFKLTDSAGHSATFNVATRKPNTIGDLIDGINNLALGVEARINETGDGILLVDTAGGTGTFNVEDIGTGTAAKQLKIAGTATSQTVGNDTVSAINGTSTIRLETTSTTTVSDLATQINELTGSPIRASVINLGSSGVRLQLNGVYSGSAARVALETDLGVAFSQTSEARDALISHGANENGGGVLVSSSTNQFDTLVDGLSISIAGASTTPVTVTVAENTDTLTTQVQTFVDQYNKLRDKYTELTAFDSTTNQVGQLFGSSVAIRLDQAFSQLLTAPIRSGSGGAIRSLPELGVKIDETGKLSFDKTQFQKVYDSNPAAVNDFFTNETNGFSKKAKDVSDRLAGVDNGALLARNQALQSTIEQNNTRISRMDVVLAKQRERLLNQFYAMETTISKLQSSTSALSSIQNLFSTSTSKA